MKKDDLRRVDTQKSGTEEPWKMSRITTCPCGKRIPPKQRNPRCFKISEIVNFSCIVVWKSSSYRRAFSFGSVTLKFATKTPKQISHKRLIIKKQRKQKGSAGSGTRVFFNTSAYSLIVIRLKILFPNTSNEKRP